MTIFFSLLLSISDGYCEKKFELYKEQVNNEGNVTGEGFATLIRNEPQSQNPFRMVSTKNNRLKPFKKQNLRNSVLLL
jgi:hypothetical protein